MAQQTLQIVVDTSAVRSALEELFQGLLQVLQGLPHDVRAEFGERWCKLVQGWKFDCVATNRTPDGAANLELKLEIVGYEELLAAARAARLEGHVHG